MNTLSSPCNVKRLFNKFFVSSRKNDLLEGKGLDDASSNFFLQHRCCHYYNVISLPARLLYLIEIHSIHNR